MKIPKRQKDKYRWKGREKKDGKKLCYSNPLSLIYRRLNIARGFISIPRESRVPTWQPFPPPLSPFPPSPPNQPRRRRTTGRARRVWVKVSGRAGGRGKTHGKLSRWSGNNYIFETHDIARYTEAYCQMVLDRCWEWIYWRLILFSLTSFLHIFLLSPFQFSFFLSLLPAPLFSCVSHLLFSFISLLPLLFIPSSSLQFPFSILSLYVLRFVFTAVVDFRISFISSVVSSKPSHLSSWLHCCRTDK